MKSDRCMIIFFVFVATSTFAFPAKASSINVSCRGVDDTVAVNDAIKVFNSPAGGSSTLSFSGAKCVVATLSPIKRSGLVRGSGGDTLETTSPTGDVISVMSDGPVIFRDIRIASSPGLVRRSGAGIRLAGAGPGSTNMNSRLENVTLDYMYDGVVLESTVGAVVSNSYITNSRHAGVLKVNTAPGLGDAGDDSIQGTIFDSADPQSTAAAILQFAGGGLRLINNKILRHRSGYVLNLRATTSDLIIVGNSFENQLQTSISFSRVATARFFNVVISGNQFALSPNVISISQDSDWLQGVVITGNSFGNLFDPKAPAVLDFNGGIDIIIESNVFMGNHGRGSAAISLGPVYPKRARIGRNHYVPGSYTHEVLDNGNASYSAVRVP